jgi:hypothetical protein
METAYDGSNNIADEIRELRGSSWTMPVYGIAPLDSSYSSDIWDASSSLINCDWTDEGSANGFRVASVPEPSTLSLLAIGLGGLALVRRRK